MEFLDPNNLPFFLFLVVPGFVAVAVYDLLVPSERRNLSDSLIGIVAYSLINLTLWALPLLLMRKYLVSDTLAYYAIVFIALVLIVFVSPALLAIGYYKLLDSRLLQGRVLHPLPTGWDWFFGKGPSCFILFHLKSGLKVGGFYGGKSYASSHPQIQQVYIEEVWELSEELEFVEKVPDTAGAIINGEDCETIELYAYEERHGG